MPLKCVTPKEFNDEPLAYTIDPGIHTAIQEWRYGDIARSKVIASLTGHTIAWRLDDLTLPLSGFVVDGSLVLIEGVDIRATSEVSMASAGRGNLSLLSCIVGAVMQKTWDKGCRVIDPILYREWAGQLSYDQLRNILRKKFKIKTSNEHMAAAIGIGLAAKGEL